MFVTRIFGKGMRAAWERLRQRWGDWNRGPCPRGRKSGSVRVEDREDCSRSQTAEVSECAVVEGWLVPEIWKGTADQNSAQRQCCVHTELYAKVLCSLGADTHHPDASSRGALPKCLLRQVLTMAQRCLVFLSPRSLETVIPVLEPTSTGGMCMHSSRGVPSAASMKRL